MKLQHVFKQHGLTSPVEEPKSQYSAVYSHLHCSVSTIKQEGYLPVKLTLVNPGLQTVEDFFFNHPHTLLYMPLYIMYIVYYIISVQENSACLILQRLHSLLKGPYCVKYIFWAFTMRNYLKGVSRNPQSMKTVTLRTLPLSPFKEICYWNVAFRTSSP